MKRVLGFAWVFAVFLSASALADPPMMLSPRVVPQRAVILGDDLRQCTAKASDGTVGACDQRLHASTPFASAASDAPAGIGRDGRANSTPDAPAAKEIPELASSTDAYVQCVFGHEDFVKSLELAKAYCSAHREHMVALMGANGPDWLLKSVDALLWQRWANQSSRTAEQSP